MKEILRYMGLHESPDEQTLQLIQDCLAEVNAVASPRHCYRQYLLEFEDGFPAIAGHVFKSRNLAKNLRGCTHAYIMAATLGNGVDRLLRRHEVSSMSRAMACQAIAAAKIEETCNAVNHEIAQHASRFHLYMRPRFSPGYGDLDLSTQKDVFELLDITREIGVALTSRMVMSPTKSVTAIIGASYEKTPCVMQGCEACAASDTCLFSRKGENK